MWGFFAALIAAGGAVYATRKQSKAQKEAIAYQEKVRTEEDAKIKKAQEEESKAANEAAQMMQQSLAAQVLTSRDKETPASFLSSPAFLVISVASIALIFFLKK